MKPSPEPPLLPREARLKTPVPQADLDAFKREFAQETAVETAHLNKVLDDLPEGAYAIEETLEPEQNLKAVLANYHVNAETVEKLATDLSNLLDRIMPAAKKTLVFTKAGIANCYRHRSRCTSRRLKGLRSNCNTGIGTHAKGSLHHTVPCADLQQDKYKDCPSITETASNRYHLAKNHGNVKTGQKHAHRHIGKPKKIEN